jgi:ketosteroid isomerase-like protein
MSTDENKRIAHQAFEALAAGDLSPLADLLAGDAILHQCGFLEPLPARAVLEGRFPGQRRILDREVRLEQSVGEGDRVALHWRTSGRMSDSEAADGEAKPVSVPAMTFIRFERGKIAEIWNIQDTATLQSQLQDWD